MFRIVQKGDVGKTEDWLGKLTKKNVRPILEHYGQRGVDALSAATAKDSGLTSESWGYKISAKGTAYSITWTNSNIVNGVPIAIILQYGHATRNGGFVQGYDYINPALRGVMDDLAMDLWKELIS